MKQKLKITVIAIIMLYIFFYSTNIVEASNNVIKESESGNYTQDEIVVDDIDFIEPDFTYETTNINKDSGTVTIIFDVTDKFYKDSTDNILELSDLAIWMKVDDNRRDNLSTISSVNKSLTNAKITNIVNGKSKVIGMRYTLTLSNLRETLRNNSDTTLDYSGILSIIINANTVTDVNGNGNIATTITSGVKIPGGTGNGVTVDVVNPIFEKVENSKSNLSDNSVSMKIKVTDTYYDETSKLTADEITTYVDGTETTSYSISVLTDSDTTGYGSKLTEQRINSSKTSTVAYGQEYTVKISGLNLSQLKQVKIKIKESAVSDMNGNGNVETQFLMLNCLKETSTETGATSGFLGNETIQRQNIESVTFVSNVSGTNSTTWDASAIGDGSIYAYYTDSDMNGALEVYIASEDTINANINSSYLFSYIGYSSNCLKTNVFTNLELLNTNNVINMNNMFQYCGYNSMTTLDLSSNFETSSATSMKEMFQYCGYKKITSFTWGTKFNTSNVTNMESMFKNFGHDELTTFSLPSTFNTNKVTNMKSMFQGLGYSKMTAFSLGTTFTTENVVNMESMFEDCGYSLLNNFSLGSNFKTSNVTNMASMFKNFGHNSQTSLSLGANFDTLKVTDMSNMFNGCGYIAMNSITLGNSFNTTNVINMESMFENCGYTSLNNLSLGNNFYTSKVTNMNNMFKNCGHTLLTNLDLGPAFTYIATSNTDFATDCGASTGSIIYCGESIYSSRHKFKINTSSDVTVDYTRGTINPKYTPYWEKVSSTIKDDNTMEIVIRGTNTYGSNITSSLSNDKIKIFIDGVETTDITKDLSEPTYNTNDVTYTLTLSNFEISRKNTDIYKEWSGNISCLIEKKSLNDIYGNGNMEKIDDESGNWNSLELHDSNVEKNTANTMFIDNIKPEITYKYSMTEEINNEYENKVNENSTDNPYINYQEKKLTVEFYVADKYFKESTLSLSDLQILIGGETLNANISANSLTSSPVDKSGNLLTTEQITNGEKQYGLKYTLVITNLQNSANDYLNYNYFSGPVSITIPENKVIDETGNANIAKTITLGKDEPSGDNDEEIVVDVVDPIWEYNTSSINRTENTVTLKIRGTDKYYLKDTITTENFKEKIKVYVDDNESVNYAYTLLQSISSPSYLTETRNETEEKWGVEYKITLGNFGDISGKVKIVIDANTLYDKSGNSNKTATTIDVGNVNWLESGDSSESPEYTAFRNSIVDFIKPVFNYQYSYTSTVDSTYTNYVNQNQTDNPYINYENKTLTVVFNTTDKYFKESSLTEDEITVKIGGKDTTGKVQKDLSSVEKSDGTGMEYTLVLSNIEQSDLSTSGYTDFSGIVQLMFASNVIHDTSGNGNNAKTITLNTSNGDESSTGIIADVVNPTWSKGESKIYYEEKYVEAEIIASDKYYLSDRFSDLIGNKTVGSTLTNSQIGNLIEVYVTDEKIPSSDFENISTSYSEYKIDDIQKTLEIISVSSTQVKYKLTLTNFGDYEGYTTIKILGDTITDLSKNKSTATVINIANTNANDAFNEGMVDFILPEWHYENSSIDRTNNTVTLDFFGLDKHIDKTRTESSADNIASEIKVYVDNVQNTTISKNVIIKSSDEKTKIHYSLTLGDFGTNSGVVKIVLPTNTLFDKNKNTNTETTIYVGKSDWVEEGDSAGTYTAFRNSVVDFVKPEITYNYSIAPSSQNVTNRTLIVHFDVIDKYLISSLTKDDVKITIDNKSVNNAVITSFTTTEITNGLRYNVQIENFEKDEVYPEGQNYIDFSGKVELTIDENKISDTSGNRNDKTTLILDKDNGDDSVNYEIVDLVRPTFYYTDESVDYESETVTITLLSTDKYYDFDYKLDSLSNVTIRTDDEDLGTNYPCSLSSKQISYGYEYTITIENYSEENEIYIGIPAGVVYDKYGNSNHQTNITVRADNQKPQWKYDSIDTSNLDTDGTLTLNFKAQDRFLIFDSSILESDELHIYKGHEDITSTISMTLSEPTNETVNKKKIMSYTLTLNDIDTASDYTVVIDENVLVDESDNYSNMATFTISKSNLSSQKFTEVTYFVDYLNYTNDNELYTINETGTNLTSETYTPSSLEELWNDGKNSAFSESLTYDSGSHSQAATAFAGWAEASSSGKIIEGGNVYGLYDEIPNTIKYLRATWKSAKVIFVSSNGNNSNDGFSPETPVKDLETAFSKLSSSNDTSNNIVVVMSEITWGSLNLSANLNKNATITSVYGGVDYRNDGAKLTVSANISMNSNLVFDNIEINSTSNTVSRTEYLYESTYTNMLICNYYDLTIGRGVTTTSDYTFASIIGGNYGTEGTIGKTTPTLRIERGKYNAIVGGSSLRTNTSTSRGITNYIEIGNKKDGARAQNNMLTITGYLMMAQNADYSKAYDANSAEIKIFSGNFTGANSFNKNGENAAIYLRDRNGSISDEITLKMYGGEISAEVYCGSINNTSLVTSIVAELIFYGGKLNSSANVYGQGIKTGYCSSTKITFSGNIQVDSTVYGGANSNNSDVYGTGATNVYVTSNSAKMNGEIYGGSCSNTVGSNQKGYINGYTNINISAGQINNDVYGGGYKAGIGTYNTTLTNEIRGAGQTNINISGGTFKEAIFGGSYQNYVGTSTNINISGTPNIECDIYGGGKQEDTSNMVGIGYTDTTWFKNSNTNTDTNLTMATLYSTTNINISTGNIGNDENHVVYGGNQKSNNINPQSDNIYEKTNITIGGTGDIPVIKSIICGSGVYDGIGTSTINIISADSEYKLTAFGGSDEENYVRDSSNINLNGATISTIYGGSKEKGTVAISNVNINSGEADNVYGGGYKSDVTNSNVNLKGGTSTIIYGGPEESNTVSNAKVTVTGGSSSNIFGGGNNASSTNSDVSINGGTIDNIYGGSNNSGVVTNAKVTLISGNITSNAFGGGYKASVTSSEIELRSGEVPNIYGGGNEGETSTTHVYLNGGTATAAYGGALNSNVTTSNINENGSSITNMYGGCNISGICQNSNVNITSGDISTAVYGGNNSGGYTINSNITIDKTSSTISCEIFGGGYQSTIGNGTIYQNGEYSTYTTSVSGSSTINIINGSFEKNVNGGSKESVVYGNVTINIGKDTITTDSSANKIDFSGNVFGGGTSTWATNFDEGINNYNYDYVSVCGDTCINIDASNYTTFNIAKNIFGSGNTSNYYKTCNTTININDLGTDSSIVKMSSIQRASNLNIGNSNIEFTGALNIANYYKSTSYCLNRIDNLTVYSNTTLYMRRGFNLVKGYNSLVTKDGDKEAVTESSGSITTNSVNNKLYVYDGINLIFSTKEGDIYDSSVSSNWGDVNGMTFFGLYTYKNGTLTKGYYNQNASATADYSNIFYGSSYIEGRKKENHDYNVDGFYTNQLSGSGSSQTIKQQIIEPLSGGLYYDWLIGEDVTVYNAELMASIFSRETLASVVLDFSYQPGTSYTISSIDTSRLKEGVSLVSPSSINEIAETDDIANSTFGLTIQTADSGWDKSGSTRIYTNESTGRTDGTIKYVSDNSNTSPVLNLKLTNSLNITQNQDLGSVRVVLTGKNKTGEDASEGKTFVTMLNINLATLFDEEKSIYMPTFTDKSDVKLTYTNDSTVDMTYKLYRKAFTSVYDSADYRDLSSTFELPIGTKITLIDYGINDSENKYYYYQVSNTSRYAYTDIDDDGNTKYIYKLGDFIEMGCSDGSSKYPNDNTRYYNDEENYAYEKYRVLLDFSESNITTSLTDEEIYMQLRNSSNTVKFNQDDEEIKFDLLTNKNAVMSQTVSNQNQEYALIDSKEIEFTYNASFYEQLLEDETTVIDSKYHDKNLGMAIEIVNDSTGKRLSFPELSSMTLDVTDDDGTVSYSADTNGVIRVNLSDMYTTLEKTMKLTLLQSSADTGKYKVRVYLFSSNDGLYYTNSNKVESDFYVNIFSSKFGVKVDLADSNRVFYSTTGMDLTGKEGMSFKASVSTAITDGSIHAVLYKRNATYNGTGTNPVYKDVSYSEVDMANYFTNEFTKSSGNEYVLFDSINIDEEKNLDINLKNNLSTGEYKLEFRLYSGTAPVQTVDKTFVVVDP